MRTSGGPGGQEAYWRRRFFILGGGLAVLMLLAWVFGGSGGPSKQQRQTAAVQASAAANQARGPLPSAAYGSAYAARPSVSAPVPGSPSVSGSGSPSATGTPSPSASTSASPSASPSASGKASGAGKPCRAGSVVLTVDTSRPVYRPGQEPKFSVYAVATAPSGCRLKYGPGAVRVVVTRHGKTVWNSADCAAVHRGTRTVRLDQGVPQQVALSWNRNAAGRSCAGTVPRGSSGTFEAVASADGFSSPARPFKLLR